MKSLPALRRCLSALLTFAILATALAAVAWSGRSPDASPGKADQLKGARSWPLFGGSIERNMVNTTERGMPTEWSAEEGSTKNIKWAADLGSKAYGGPVVAGGKVFVGTNNEKPRNPEITGDKGIIMCFRESDGQ